MLDGHLQRGCPWHHVRRLYASLWNCPLDLRWYGEWFRKFHKQLKQCNARPLEVSRAKWTTADNMKRHYDIVHQTLLQKGLAVLNPWFNDKDPQSAPILLSRSNRVFSFDETELRLNMTNEVEEDQIVVPCTGIGEVLASSSSRKLTAVGGSFASGDSLPALSKR